jgi:hypothetical protein
MSMILDRMMAEIQARKGKIHVERGYMGVNKSTGNGCVVLRMGGFTLLSKATLILEFWTNIQSLMDLIEGRVLMICDRRMSGI